MAAIGYHRGHLMRFDDDRDTWIYVDTGRSVHNNRDRRCGFCGLANTLEGHDGCIGTVPGAVNACCGHGRADEAYVQYPDRSIRGIDALKAMARDLRFSKI